jgi:hypothetical protein
MPEEMVLIGSVTALITVCAFGGAVRETFRLTSLKLLYDPVVQEPIPDRLILVLNSLGEDDGTGSN